MKYNQNNAKQFSNESLTQILNLLIALIQEIGNSTDKDPIEVSKEFIEKNSGLILKILSILGLSGGAAVGYAIWYANAGIFTQIAISLGIISTPIFAPILGGVVGLAAAITAFYTITNLFENEDGILSFISIITYIRSNAILDEYELNKLSIYAEQLKTQIPKNYFKKLKSIDESINYILDKLNQKEREELAKTLISLVYAKPQTPEIYNRLIEVLNKLLLETDTNIYLLIDKVKRESSTKTKMLTKVAQSSMQHGSKIFKSEDFLSSIKNVLIQVFEVNESKLSFLDMASLKETINSNVEIINPVAFDKIIFKESYLVNLGACKSIQEAEEVLKYYNRQIELVVTLSNTEKENLLTSLKDEYEKLFKANFIE